MKPILFSTEMVQAILDGRKSITRRVVKPDIVNRFDICPVDGPVAYIDQETGDSYRPEDLCRYKVGDVLWVRETWYKNYPHKYGRYFYRADGEEIDMPTIYGETIKYGKADGLKWRPSIFMPKEAARLFLQVANVRVERLQDITEEDALKEGVKAYGPNNCSGTSARIAFAELWDSLNEKRGYGWNTNCWVWVIEFERVEGEEVEG
jgi:hypothetical protein